MPVIPKFMPVETGFQFVDYNEVYADILYAENFSIVIIRLFLRIRHHLQKY